MACLLLCAGHQPAGDAVPHCRRRLRLRRRLCTGGSPPQYQSAVSCCSNPTGRTFCKCSGSLSITSPYCYSKQSLRISARIRCNVSTCRCSAGSDRQRSAAAGRAAVSRLPQAPPHARGAASFFSHPCDGVPRSVIVYDWHIIIAELSSGEPARIPAARASGTLVTTVHTPASCQQIVSPV